MKPVAQITSLAQALYDEGYQKGYADAMGKILAAAGLNSNDATSKVAEAKRKRAPKGEAKEAVVAYIADYPGCSSGEIVIGLPHLKERAVRTALQRLNAEGNKIEKREKGWFIHNSLA